MQNMSMKTQNGSRRGKCCCLPGRRDVPGREHEAECTSNGIINIIIIIIITIIIIIVIIIIVVTLT
jgi:heme/copper-type cytochrome/quinol oxidase subunit 2